jgi:hypothetical protein
MAQTVTTVAAGFRELLTRVELNATRINSASQRYNAVKQRVESALPGKEVSQIGSFQRKTKIRPANEDDPLDIDLIVSFGEAHRYAAPGEQGTTPASALETVRRALVSDGTYKLMDPKPDAPTVVLEYSDGFIVELAPCFKDLTGQHPRPGGPACYIVGTSAGGWVPADYDYDAAFISGANQLPAVAQALVPSIKMVKQFLRGQNIELKSFHVEILCALTVPQSVAGWNQQNLRWGYQHVLAQFLSQAPALLNGPVAIPGSCSPAVDSGLSAYRLQQIGQYLAKCGECACGICKVTDEGQALDLWRQFYGDPFPA